MALPEARLACAILQQAFEDLTLYPTPHDPHNVVAYKNADREQAREWLLDHHSMDLHSLRWVCAVISVSTGLDICPVAVSDACRRGVTLTEENSIRRGPGFNSQRRIRLRKRAA